MITFNTVMVFAAVSNGAVLDSSDEYYNYHGYGVKVLDMKYTSTQTINDINYQTLTYSPTLYEKRKGTMSHTFGVDVGVISIDEKVLPFISPWINFQIGPVNIGLNHTFESITTTVGVSL